LPTNDNYWIDFGSGNIPVLDFYSYEIVGTNGLQSQPKFRFLSKFYMSGNVAIKSNERVVTESDTLIVIDAICRLLLETTNNRHIITFDLSMQDDRRMYRGGYCFFSTFINPRDAENLMHIIKGESVRIGWRINGYASPINPSQTYPIMPFEASNLLQEKNRWRQITPDEFSNNVIRRLGLTEEFMIGFPLKIPPSITAHPNLPPGIKGLSTDLNTLVSNLNSAVNVLRNPRSSNDYRQVMDQVKTSVETIRSYIKNLNNKQNLAKEIFIDTGVITYIDPTGAAVAAEDVIEKFGNMLENLYQISSKPAHTTPKQSQPQKRFKFSPGSSDAEFVLTLGLASAKYIMEKIQEYFNHNS
jgi:hypothetical protein